MKSEREHGYREVIERYCNVINDNTAIIRSEKGKEVSYVCLSEAQCEKRFGGCRNTKYGRKIRE